MDLDPELLCLLGAKEDSSQALTPQAAKNNAQNLPKPKQPSIFLKITMTSLTTNITSIQAIYFSTRHSMFKYQHLTQVLMNSKDALHFRAQDSFGNVSKHNKHGIQDLSPFPAGDHKANRNIHHSTTHTSMKHNKQQTIHKRSTVLKWSVKYFYWRA